MSLSAVIPAVGSRAVVHQARTTHHRAEAITHTKARAIEINSMVFDDSITVRSSALSCLLPWTTSLAASSSAPRRHEHHLLAFLFQHEQCLCTALVWTA